MSAMIHMSSYNLAYNVCCKPTKSGQRLAQQSIKGRIVNECAAVQGLISRLLMHVYVQNIFVMK